MSETHCIIPLCSSSGQIKAKTLVDAADYAFLSQWKWRLATTGYAHRWRGSDNVIFMHRVIMDAPKGLEVDHINRDCLDNRRSNLRLVTHAQNGQNQRTREGRKYRGVRRRANGRWQAVCHHKGKGHYAGTFATIIEAALAAQKLREKILPFSSF